jgi:predicted nucleotidyltransferase
MRPSATIEQNLDEVRAILARYPVKNARLFGSVSRGDDVEGSDVDILVDPTDATTLMDLAGLKLELQELLGVAVDIATPAALTHRIAENVADDLKPL